MATENADKEKEFDPRLEAVFDRLQEGLIFLDLNQNITRINRNAAQLLGLEVRTYSSEEIAGRFDVFLPSGDFLPEDERPAAKAQRGEFLSNVKLFVRSRVTGTTDVVEMSTAPVIGKNGIPREIVVIYHNVTEPHTLAQSRALLADIVESSEDALIGEDIKGIVTSWNKGAEKIFGYTSAEMVGQSIRRLLAPGREQEEDRILEQIRNGETVIHIETERVTKSGKALHISLTVSSIRDIAGRIVGASKIARNVTERKQFEHQLLQSQKMEAIGQLTGGIAHDFNNLLAIVIGNLDLLERHVTDDAVALKRVQSALKGALRGADLTKRLLAFSSKQKLVPRNTSIAESIESLLDFASRAVGPEIRISTRIDDNLPRVLVDVAFFESTLLNLVVNARDAMPKGGTLTVTAEFKRLEPNYPTVLTGELKPGNFVCICVSDTARGMSPEVLERAFEPFFTTKTLDKGTGLGLAMVYGFAKQCGGTVRIYSEIGYGTTVSLYLPFATNIETAKPQLLADVEHAHRPGSVLVVDDEEVLLEIAREYLEEMGFRVYQAKNGSEALDVFTREPEVGLLVTDVIMPGGMMTSNSPSTSAKFALTFVSSTVQAFPWMRSPNEACRSSTAPSCGSHTNATSSEGS